jgi:hypothetical protein
MKPALVLGPLAGGAAPPPAALEPAVFAGAPAAPAPAAPAGRLPVVPAVPDPTAGAPLVPARPPLAPAAPVIGPLTPPVPAAMPVIATVPATPVCELPAVPTFIAFLSEPHAVAIKPHSATPSASVRVQPTAAGRCARRFGELVATSVARNVPTERHRDMNTSTRTGVPLQIGFPRCVAVSSPPSAAACNRLTAFAHAAV